MVRGTLDAEYQTLDGVYSKKEGITMRPQELRLGFGESFKTQPRIERETENG